MMVLYFLLASCKAPMYTIGMNEQDFLKHNKVTAVKQTESISIYKKINYPFGAPAIVKFFYFQNGKLIQVDEGQRAVDYRIQVDN